MRTGGKGSKARRGRPLLRGERKPCRDPAQMCIDGRRIITRIISEVGRIRKFAIHGCFPQGADQFCPLSGTWFQPEQKTAGEQKTRRVFRKCADFVLPCPGPSAFLFQFVENIAR